MSARVSITAAWLLLLPAALLADESGGGVTSAGSVQTIADASPSGPAVPNGSLTGGTLRLDPLLPGGGGTSTSVQFQLTASIGQPGVAQSDNGQQILLTGFWTPAHAVADRVFRDGFD